eukprot:458546_1
MPAFPDIIMKLYSQLYGLINENTTNNNVNTTDIQFHAFETTKQNKMRVRKTKEEHIEFGNSYYISVNCHICNIHFTDIEQYKIHLKEHYINDPKKTWRECDHNNCNIKSGNVTKFVAHIATHTKNKPYKCNVIINGIKCNYSNGYKSDLKRHWQSINKKK